MFSLEEENTYTHLRNVKITVFYLNTYTKRYFAQQTGFRSIDFGSIFLLSMDSEFLLMVIKGMIGLVLKEEKALDTEGI